MTFIGDDLDDVAYDFLGYANELLHNLDISDELNLIRRAIERSLLRCPRAVHI